MSNSVGNSKSFRRALIASVSGQALEWYDFYIYGLAAALVFPRLFFPGSSTLVGVLASFGTFAVGFIARPVGGLLFGRLGDRIGRSRTLVLTLLLMGISTIGIGLLPGYDTIGFLAPLLLIVFRIAQGVGVGGEWSGASVLVLEYAPSKRRGLFTGMINSGEYIGILIATLLFTALSGALSDEAFHAWGWRVPFLVSVVGIAISLVIRRSVEEPPAFRKIEGAVSEKQPSLGASLRAQGRNIIVVIGLKLFENAAAYVITAFAVTYATMVGEVPVSVTTLGISLAALVSIPMIPMWGYLSDRIGRKPVFLIGLAFLVAFFWPFFLILDTQDTVLIWLAFTLAYGLGMAPMLSVEPSWFAEMFPTEFRFTGTAVGSNIAAVLGGGFAPFIATALLAVGGNGVGLILAYVGVLAVITLVSALFARETRGEEIEQSELLPVAMSAANALVTDHRDRDGSRVSR